MFKNTFILILFALNLFMSCQDEVTEVTQPNEEETIAAGSSLAISMQRTATNDGSNDNIIDGANCLSIELPVTVVVNGIEIIIDSEEDYEVIEAIFDEFDDDDDSIEIQFPITIILSDYTQITIENYEQLEEFIDECSGENEIDDDIECIDFAYPISISVYNAEFQVIDTITINSDAELYDFIEDIEGGLLASINFPVTMILADGSTLVVNNNSELNAAIENADETCDEDDDYDYDDDDNNDIPSNDFIDILTDCSWIVDRLEVNDQDLEDQYVNYVFNFNVNGTVQVTNNGTTFSGTWELVAAAGIQVNLNIPDLPDFNNDNWILHEIDDHDGEFRLDFRNLDDRLRFERFECENAQCSETEVDNYLIECTWQVVSYNSSNDLISFQLNFNSNQELVVTNNGGDSVTGTWSTSQSNNGSAEVVIDGINLALIQAINGSWIVVECQSDRLELEMGTNNLVMEQSCSDDPLGCLETNTIVLCDENNDGYEVFNLYEGLSDVDGCTVNTTVSVSYHTSLSDAETNSNPIPSVTAFTNTSNPQTIYVRIEEFNNPSVYEILEMGLLLQDCSNSGSVEDLEAFIVDGTWIVASYIDSGDNETAVYSNYTLEFSADGSVVATDGGTNTFYGTWDAFLSTSSDLKLLLDFATQVPFDEFNDDWLVIDLQTNRIELYDLSGGDGTEDFLVFEKL